MVEEGGVVIVIDETRCDGCGLCLGACPEAALYLVGGKAVVDAALCQGCGSCTVACPTGALALSSPGSPQLAGAVYAPEAAATRVLAPQAAPPVIYVNTRPAPVPLRSRLLPVVGAALAWAGREIVPALAEVALDRLDRWAAETGMDRVPPGEGRAEQRSTRQAPEAGRGQGMGNGRRQRRQRRGGC